MKAFQYTTAGLALQSTNTNCVTPEFFEERKKYSEPPANSFSGIGLIIRLFSQEIPDKFSSFFEKFSGMTSMAGVGVVLLLSLTSCNNAKETTSDEPVLQKEKQIQRVEVIQPSTRAFEADIVISGTAEPNREVMVHALEGGYLKGIYKDIGDRVRKGEVIARLDNPELIRQKQQLEAELEGKKSIYDRLQATYDKTPAITPLQVLEEAKSAYLSLVARLASINDRIGYLRVKAPFSGIVTKRMVDEGALIQNGITSSNSMPLFEIQELNPVRLNIPVPESDLRSIQKGMDVSVTFPQMAGKSFDAKVSRMAGAMDRDSKTMRVEIDIPNPSGTIKPGMYAKVQMAMGSRDNVLSLPVTAQQTFQNQPFVLMVTDGVVSRVPLRKGLSNKDYFEVLNPDISANTQVIIQGKGLVKPGDRVEAVMK